MYAMYHVTTCGVVGRFGDLAVQILCSRPFCSWLWWDWSTCAAGGSIYTEMRPHREQAFANSVATEALVSGFNSVSHPPKTPFMARGER